MTTTTTAAEGFMQRWYPAAECRVVTEDGTDNDGYAVVLNGVWLHDRAEPTPADAWQAACDGLRRQFRGEFC